ncbi:protein hunchback-like [Tropilaelaps mercedesae]|uniref:Protein hunchback n=1 Tax=Tropilaelaps mercedesae TaxID=418985 RepID=A0A1V9XAV1_9ACAR|nr:protein hunchback-like [Tropilaelaps mercedesae]
MSARTADMASSRVYTSAKRNQVVMTRRIEHLEEPREDHRVEKVSDGIMLSDALSRGLFPFLPQLPALHGLPAMSSAVPLSSPPLTNQVESVPKHRCNLCGFECDNAAEYEQHLNTHFDHRCPYCDYTSKTEGRLKRHVKDFHEAPPTAEGLPTASFVSSTGPGSQHSESDDSSSQPNPVGTGVGASCGGTSAGQQKPRISKCKACGFVAETKTEFWEHSKMHIKQGKMLECPQCPFVTEYKHHLEYHLRNHFGSKPFKCAKCNYSCVNKSMLNSHMKSHSNVYQYRCEDCNYATKYCHSLKLHLRKYSHKPAIVLNPDGTPNPYPIIDVYGTRRGPRPKKGAPSSSPGRHGTVSSTSLPDAATGQPLPLLQTPLSDVASLLRSSNEWMNFPFAWPSAAAAAAALDGVDRAALANGVLPDLSLLAGIPGQTLLSAEGDADLESDSAQTQLEANMFSDIASSMTELSTDDSHTMQRGPTNPVGPLDLPMSPTSAVAMPTPEQSETDVQSTEHSSQVKSEPLDWPVEDVPLDLSRSAPHSPVLTPALSGPASEHAPQSPTSGALRSPATDRLPRSPPEADERTQSPRKPTRPQTPNKCPPATMTSVAIVPSTQSSSSRRKGRAFKLETFQCDFCDMLFKDVDMFSMHMNYHGFEDPFKCHVCGLQTPNRLAFFVHLTRDPHN